MTHRKQRPRYIVVQRSGRLSYGYIACEGVPDNWVVRAPFKMTDRLMFWTQSSEQQARNFYRRLLDYMRMEKA